MATIRAIKGRIKSAESTGQITKSMKLVAASKMHRTQESMSKLRSFSQRCAQFLADMPADVVRSNPFLSPHPERKKVCYVLIVGNRGLCGIYNTGVSKYLSGQLDNGGVEAQVIVLGRWEGDIASEFGDKVIRRMPLSDTPTAAEAREISEVLCKMYLEGEADEIVFVYNGFKSVLSQMPVSRILFPAAQEPSEASDVEYIYEPDRESIIKTLIDMYIDNTVYAVLLEARTSEHAARMTAMTAASDNTDELVAELNLELNHARQSAITTEISEIVGGSAALAQ